MCTPRWSCENISENIKQLSIFDGKVSLIGKHLSPLHFLETFLSEYSCIFFSSSVFSNLLGGGE